MIIVTTMKHPNVRCVNDVHWINVNHPKSDRKISKILLRHHRINVGLKIAHFSFRNKKRKKLGQLKVFQSHFRLQRHVINCFFKSHLHENYRSWKIASDQLHYFSIISTPNAVFSPLDGSVILQFETAPRVNGPFDKPWKFLSYRTRIKTSLDSCHKKGENQGLPLHFKKSVSKSRNQQIDLTMPLTSNSLSYTLCTIFVRRL